jgi:hypothetical protein
VGTKETSVTSSHNQLLPPTFFRNSELGKMLGRRNTICYIKITTSTNQILQEGFSITS